MKKFTKIAAFVFAVCLGATAMTACGDSSKKNPSDKKDIEQAMANMDDDEFDAMVKKVSKERNKDADAAEPTTAAENKFEPTAEIKNAPIDSGYIQICDSVFRNGDYVTVGEFVEKYKGEFDMSDIALNDYLTGAEPNNPLYARSYKDPEITISILYHNPKASSGEKTRIADTTVKEVIPYGETAGSVFYPGAPVPMDHDEILDYITGLGLKESSSLGIFEANSFKELYNCFQFRLTGKDSNLYGEYPEVVWTYNFDEKTLNGSGVSCQVT